MVQYKRKVNISRCRPFGRAFSSFSDTCGNVVAVWNLEEKGEYLVKSFFYKVLKKKEISDKMRGHEYAMMVYAVNG